jgi:2-hydroxy-3-keto-5-methylthiopentenyl-1-phosphate phosphatase
MKDEVIMNQIDGTMGVSEMSIQLKDTYSFDEALALLTALQSSTLHPQKLRDALNLVVGDLMGERRVATLAVLPTMIEGLYRLAPEWIQYGLDHAATASRFDIH